MTSVIFLILGYILGYFSLKIKDKYNYWKKTRLSNTYFELDNKKYRITAEAGDYILSYIGVYPEASHGIAFKRMVNAYTGVQDYKTGKLIVNNYEVIKV